MRSARVQIEAMLARYEDTASIAKKLIERKPNLDDGRLQYWEGKAEACQEILALLDIEAKRLAQMIQKQLGDSNESV